MKDRTPRADRAAVLLLHAIQRFDRLRLQWRRSRVPGLEIDPSASTNFAAARYELAEGARLRIAAGAVTERRPGALQFLLGPGARVDVGEGAWLRTEAGPVSVVAYAGARIELGPESFLNGCSVSAKDSVTLGRRAFVGMGTRIFDADQHDFDDTTPEAVEPVHIGDFVWVASDVTVLRGVTIGEHSVVGTRSLVTDDVPPHSLAYGLPARVQGVVGDRSHAR